MIPRMPSTGEKLMQGLGLAAQSIPDIIGEYRQSKQLEEERQRTQTQKLLGSSTKDVPSFLKTYHPSLHANPLASKQITDLYRNIIQENPDADPYEAQNLAIQQYRDLLALPEGSQREKAVSDAFSLEPMKEKAADFFSLLKERGKPTYQKSPEEREAAWQEFVKGGKPSWQLTPEERAAKEYPYGVGSYVKQHPGKAAAGVGLSVLEPLEMLSTITSPSQWAPALKEGTLTPISNTIREKAGFGELSEEGQKEAAILEASSAAIPWGGLLKSIMRPLKGLGAALKGTQVVEEAAGAVKGAQIAEEGAAASKAGAIGEGVAEAEQSALAGRVKADNKKTAADIRVERAKPSHKMYKQKAQEELRKTHLNLHPKYVEEISADAADRALRAEKVLGPRAQASKAQRMQIAQSQLPKSQEDYMKAISRVRALENQLVQMPNMANEITPLIEVAVNELKDAEFLLKQTMNNALAGESRVGLEAMREAAQKKVLDVSDLIIEGKEVKLPLKDYNPEMIKKAKALPKKPLPANKQDDFFTQVHGEYQKVYQDKMAKIDKEISELAEDKSMRSLHKRIQLKKERDVLKKMSDHVDAENAIHRHKLALREIQQRKVASDRLGKLQPSEGKPEVAEAARPAIESRAQMAERMKTAEGRAQVADEAVENAAAKAKTPQEAQEIRSQKSSVKEALEEINKKSEKLKEKVTSPIKTKEDIARKRRSIIGDVQDLLSSLPKGPKAIWNTRLGRDILIGTTVPLVTEILKEADIGLSGSAVVSAVLGGGGARGSAYRALVTAITKKLMQEFKKNRVKEAIKSGNDKRYAELSKKYGKALTKKAQEELY